MFAQLCRSRSWVITLAVMVVGLIAGGIVARVLTQRGDLAYRFAAGERHRYQLHYASAGFLDLNAITTRPNTAPGQPRDEGQVQSLQIVVEGELVMDVLETTAERVLLAYSLPKSEVVLTMGAQPLLDTAAGMAAELAEPVFAEVDLKGRIRSLRFPPASSEIARNCLRSLLTAVQVVLPDDPEANDEWESWEDSFFGRCRSVYQSSSDTPWGTIGLVKVRQEYEQPTVKKRLNEPRISTTLHPAGGVRIAFDPALGQVRSVKGTESLTIKVGDKDLSASEDTVALVHLKKETLPVNELERLCLLGKDRIQAVAAESLVRPAARFDEMLAYRQGLGDATLESLQADLAREERADPSKDQTPLFLKLKALIAVQPETCLRLGELAVRSDARSLTMKLVPAALGAVGNDQSQAALVGILKALAPFSDGAGEGAVQRLLALLSQLKKPGDLAEQAVRDWALRSPKTAMSNQAQLFLGTMARNLAETSPERSAKIVAWAAQELQAAVAVDNTCHFLMVLGNAGTPETLPVIRPYLSDKSASVRVRAVEALRFIDENEAEAALIKALSADPDADVRAAAVAACNFRYLNPKVFQTSQQALRWDNSPVVKLAVLNLLWQVRETNAEVLSLVANVAGNDSSADVRRAAAQLLASMQ